jgi:hypothetical protein
MRSPNGLPIILTNENGSQYMGFGAGEIFDPENEGDAVEKATYSLQFIPGNRPDDLLDEEALDQDLDLDGDKDDTFQLGNLVRSRNDNGEQRIFSGHTALKVNNAHAIFQISGEKIATDIGNDGVHNPDDNNEKFESEDDLNLNGHWDCILTIQLLLVNPSLNETTNQLLIDFSTNLRLSNAR